MKIIKSLIIILLILLTILIYKYLELYKDSTQNKNIINKTLKDIEIEKNYNEGLNKLLELNSDTVGWLFVNGTNINYPVLQTNNNQYYLSHNFNKDSNKEGWIFMDYKSNIDDLTYNTIIYGHNTYNDNMFSSLNNILTKSWYENPNNYIITLYTLEKKTTWLVFSVYKKEKETYYLQNNFSSEDDFLKFLDIIKERSIYNFNTEIDYNTKILTLTTCADNSNYRVVLHAKLLN